MALWPWKIVRDGVRTAFATFMTPHYIWAHWPNQTLCAQNSSFPKNISCFKHVRVDSNIYECWLIISEHADLSKPWHPVLFFWTAPCSFQLSKQWDFLRIVCHRVFKWGKVKGWKCFSSGACIVYLSHPQAAAADTNAIISCCLGKRCPISFIRGICRIFLKINQIRWPFVTLRKAQDRYFAASLNWLNKTWSGVTPWAFLAMTKSLFSFCFTPVAYWTRSPLWNAKVRRAWLDL